MVRGTAGSRFPSFRDSISLTNKVSSIGADAPLENYIDLIVFTSGNVKYVLSVRSTAIVFNKTENGQTTRIWALQVPTS